VPPPIWSFLIGVAVKNKPQLMSMSPDCVQNTASLVESQQKVVIGQSLLNQTRVLKTHCLGFS
jgi:hypothetical protein